MPGSAVAACACTAAALVAAVTWSFYEPLSNGRRARVPLALIAMALVAVLLTGVVTAIWWRQRP
jgi:hypothetical protein